MRVHVKLYPGACHGHMILALEAPAVGLTCQCGLAAFQDVCIMLKRLFDHVN